MNFTIPSDFTKSTIVDIVKLIKKYPEHKIVEVYGNLSNYIIIGSGRGYLDTNQLCHNLVELQQYIDFINLHNIDFNYTINAACTDNAELIMENQKDIIRKIDKLISLGIKKYTVASLSLLDFLHNAYKDNISLTLSTIANINSVSRIKRAEILGATTVVLGEDVTRNIGLIKHITKNSNISIEIIVNSMCNFNCIYRNTHYNALAHYNRDDDNTMIQYFPIKCQKHIQNEPVELIKSPWIRPEDLIKYEDIGVNLFKIIGREIVSKMKLAKMLEYYFMGEYDGNLLELNNGFSSKTIHKINNRKLDGFIDHFFNTPFRCFDICGTGECNYCNRYLNNSLINT